MSNQIQSLIHIGFGNIVNTDKIVAIVVPESAPAKRMIQQGKEKGLVVDVTHGRKTKSVLLMDNNQLILSAFTPETIAQRAQGKSLAAKEDENES